MTIHSRSIVLAAIFLSCWGFLGVRARSAPLPSRAPLLELPLNIADWQGRAGPTLDANVLAVLGVDDHLSRIYTNANSRQTGLYIGFHESQKQGDSLHSPMNCLPGAGWLPGPARRLALRDPRGPAHPAITVNRVIVQKGETRQLVLYWYQSQGRVIASEYAAKAYLFVDAVRRARTDAALVRIVTAIDGSASAEEAAEHAAASFAEALLPLLPNHLPS